MDNVVTYPYAKFDYNRLWNAKALADGKRDNNNTKKKNISVWVQQWTEPTNKLTWLQ